MKMLDLCSGIGGISLAASYAGIDTVAFCEIDPFCSAVLKKHWPLVPNLGDIRDVSEETFRATGIDSAAIDMVAAGFPCQPTSLAGKRRGKADDRWLWPDVYRVIAAVRPRWVLLENTAGILSLGVEAVLADLEGKDDQEPSYEAQVWLIPASAVGAPHQRERVFILAHTQGKRQGGLRGRSAPLGKVVQLWAGDSRPHVADANGHRQRNGQGESQHESSCCEQTNIGLYGEQESLADPAGARPQGQIWTESSILANPSRYGLMGHASGAGWQEQYAAAQPGWAADPTGRSAAQWGTGQAQSGLGRVLNGISCWLDRHRWPAAPGQVQEEWEPPRVTREDIPNRVARLKALGNAVVPQQVLPLLQAIMAAEQEEVA